MKCNSPLPKQTTGQNQAKLLKMFIYITKIVPLDPQGSQSNVEKIDLWRISHANWNAKISSLGTLVAKEPVLLLLRL